MQILVYIPVALTYLVSSYKSFSLEVLTTTRAFNKTTLLHYQFQRGDSSSTNPTSTISACEFNCSFIINMDSQPPGLIKMGLHELYSDICIRHSALNTCVVGQPSSTSSSGSISLPIPPSLSLFQRLGHNMSRPDEENTVIIDNPDLPNDAAQFVDAIKEGSNSKEDEDEEEEEVMEASLDESDKESVARSSASSIKPPSPKKSRPGKEDKKGKNKQKSKSSSSSGDGSLQEWISNALAEQSSTLLKQMKDIRDDSALQVSEVKSMKRGMEAKIKEVNDNVKKRLSDLDNQMKSTQKGIADLQQKHQQASDRQDNLENTVKLLLQRIEQLENAPSRGDQEAVRAPYAPSDAPSGSSGSSSASCDRSMFIVYIGDNVPREAAEKYLKENIIDKHVQARAIKFEIDTLDGAAPRTSYLFMRAKSGDGKTGVQKCWELKILVDAEPPSTLDGKAKVWIQPCRPQAEREHRKLLNQGRRFLHWMREEAGIAAKIQEHGCLVAAVGGKYYPMPKANITWRGKPVAKITSGAIEWLEDGVLNSVFLADFRDFSPTAFRSKWAAFLN